MAEALGATLWSPRGGGFLTGKYRTSDEGRLKGLGGVLLHTEKTSRETTILDEGLAVANESTVSPTHVAVAWLLHKVSCSTTSLIPILGPRTREQLDSTLGAPEVTLSPQQIERLDAVSDVPLGVPHELNRTNAPRLAGGKNQSLHLPGVPVVWPCCPIRRRL
jgi:aryl-alcohol dehydrogenase-like predicted oxidoreductase